MYYPGMEFDAGLTDVNPVDKLFIGFSFDRTNEDEVTHISGLPTNLSKIFFSGLDSSINSASGYQDLIDNPDSWGVGTLGLVVVSGSKEDDIRNDALYKKINGVFIDVTTEFMYCDFSSCDLNNAYFFHANNLGSKFDFANNENARFSYANNQGAGFYSANNKRARFEFANNQEAIFDNSNNEYTIFESANNENASFHSSNNETADFSYANNLGSNFYYANNKRARFEFANNETADFSYANNQEAIFDNSNNEYANFQSSNNQGARFSYANLKYASWNNVISIQNANFQNSDLTGGINLPERINTKAKWIAECGVGNVNAETIWIDGTSILE